MVEDRASTWFSASGFELLGVVDDGVELVVEVQYDGDGGGLLSVRSEGDTKGPPVGGAA